MTIHWEVEGLEVGNRGRNDDDDTAPEYRLVFSVPDGFYPFREDITRRHTGDFDAAVTALELLLEDTRGTTLWLVAPSAEGEFLIEASVVLGDETFATAELSLDDERFLLIRPGGGQAADEAAAVRVTFPGRAVSQSMRVWIRPPRSQSEPIYPLGSHPFEIVVEEQAALLEPDTPEGPSPTPSETPTDQPPETPSTEEPSPTPPETPEDQPTETPSTEEPRGNWRPVRQFEAPITVEVAYDENELQGDERSLILYYYDETSGTWQALPSSVDVENNILTAETTHLTVFDYTAQNFEAARLPSMAPFQTAPFTGAATYSYSLWVPPGPGGLQPELMLSYNSQVVDGSDSDTQASWVGMGWSLDTGSIVRNTHSTIDYPGDDTYSFEAGGVSSRLLPGADGYYHTSEESFWRIRYDAGADTWTAWDGSGTEYEFNHRARYAEYNGCTSVTTRTWRWSLTTVRNLWGQDLAFTYTTEPKDTQDSCGTNPATIDVAVYPSTIVYPHGRYRVVFESEADRLDYLEEWTGVTSRIQFQRSGLTHVRVEQDADGNGSFETLMRRYDLSYESNPLNRVSPGVAWPYDCTSSGCSVYQGNLTLAQVQEFGLGGSQSLPSLRFGYSGNHLAWAENGYGGRVEFDYEMWYETGGGHETRQACDGEDFDGWTNGQCNNGSPQGRFYIYSGQSLSANYGLVRRFQPGGAYWIQATAFGCQGCQVTLQAGINDGLQTQNLPAVQMTDGTTETPVDGVVVLPASASQAQLLLTGSNWSLSEYSITPLLTRYRVSEMRVYDGVNQAPDVFTFEYTGAATNDPAHSAAASEPAETRYAEPYSDFRGHSEVRQVSPGGRMVTTSYNQDDIFSGMPYRIRNGYDDGRVLSQTETTYDHVEVEAALSDLSVFPHTEAGLVFTDLHIFWPDRTTEETRLLEGDTDYAARRSEYQYLESDQGGGQYGNLTRTIESSWNGSAWVPYRAARTSYFPNTDAPTYLVGLPGLVEQFSCSGGGCSFDGGTLLASTWPLYDGSTSYDAPPNTGALTGLRVWADSLGGGPRFRDETYEYDGWGNQTEATAHTSYGSSTSMATGGGRTTSTEYDGTYHTYSVGQTNALGHTVSWVYDFSRGLPVEEEDSNGAVTSASYDAFGRVTAVRRPGDESGPATLAVEYHDSSSPYWVGITQRLDAVTQHSLVHVYNGLGQRIQTQASSAVLSAGERDVIVDYAYDAYGALVEQTIPYAVSPWSGSGHPFRGHDWNQPSTTTTYDALGRPLVVTATDNTTQSYLYDDLETNVTDALGRQTRTLRDIWGRTFQVIPPAGPSVTYTYDRLDRMTQVDTGGATTLLVYDQAGRKVGMTDPDMGEWAYEFDAIGNLSSQTDSRGCEIAFSYDLLNRPTSRAYTGPGACGDTGGVSYSYDSSAGSNYGVGRRTGMNDGSGTVSWRFDIRGRLVREVRVIDGAGTYATEWGYNSADLQVWMRYPGGDGGEAGEQVDFSYLPQESLSSVTSSFGAYVGRTDYDASGRIDIRVMGSDVFQTDYSYYAWTAQGGQGRLQQIQSGPSGSPSSLQDLRYTYDDVGDVTRIEDWLAGTPQAQTFAYDALYRLTSASVTGGSEGLYSETYEYDATTGNLSSFGGVAYAYEDTGHAHAVTDLDGVERYRYDAAGNQTWRYFETGTYTLTYDAENRLVVVRESGELVAEFVYDGDGNLVREVADGRTTVYVGGHLEVEIGSTPVPTPTSSGPTATFYPTPTASHTPTPTATGGSDLIFADGFESGNLSAWSSSQSDGGDLSATSSAALVGSFGLQAVIDDGNPIYVVDESPNAEPRYRSRFYFDPNSIAMASSDVHDVLMGYSPAPSVAFRVMFRCTSGACPGVGTYQFRVGARTDASSWSYTGWQSISDAPHSLEFDWRAASPAGANNGGLTLWLDGVQAADVANIDNDTFLIDRVLFGIVGAPLPGTSGTEFFDAFESRRQSYIGPDTGSPTPTATPTASGTPSPTATASVTPTPTSTRTPTTTRTRTPTRTGTPSRTPTATETATPSVTPTPGTGNGLAGEYYDNSDFTWLKLVRTDATVNFAWGTGSPGAGIGADTFSVRWTGYVQPRFSETYTFYLYHDDIGRLWVDNQLLINQSTPGEHSANIALTAGVRYPVRLELVENTGDADARLYWSSTHQPKEIIPQSQLFSASLTPTATPASGLGLTGEYFDNVDFTALKVTRTDATVYFAWGTGAPAPGVAVDTFSVRWTGYVQPRFSETYTFYLYHDDAAHLWVDNQSLIDQSAVGEHSGSIVLAAGVRYAIRLELVENTGDADARLYWSSPTQAREVVPQAQLFPGSWRPTPTPGAGSGLAGEYFDDDSFGYLRVVRTDATVDFSWGQGSPDPLIAPDTFSVRWTGYVQPRFSETYTFYFFHEDVGRLWVDNQLLINQSTPGEHSANIALTAGVRYPIRLELVEMTFDASARLYWSGPSQPKEIIPRSQLFSQPPPTLTPTATAAAGNGLAGEYYDNSDFTWLKLVRTDATVNFAWGTGSPGAGIGADTFSARWTGYVQPRFSETYTFYLYHNDVGRLWVDNQLLIDQSAVGEHSGTIALAAGVRYAIRLELVENTGDADARLYWSSTSQPKQIIPQSQLFSASLTPTATPANGAGLTGEYFDNVDFTALKVTRTDAAVNFAWGTGAPAPGVGVDTFSVRWTGYVQPRFSETYTFHLYHDNAAHLWVDNQSLIDQSAVGEHSGTIVLAAGVRYAIRLELVENTGDADARLYWSSPTQAREVIPQTQLFPAGFVPTNTATATRTPTTTPSSTPSPTRTPTATPTTGPTPSVPAGEVWRFYYFAGAQRVAMRVQGDPIPAHNGIFYFLADHLGSTTVTVDADGEPVGELRYRAFGATRFASGAPGTDYRYTGQREVSEIGLYYYRARWFDPALGRFVQADTTAGGDRYAYVRNNPVRYTDPTGHDAWWCTTAACGYSYYGWRSSAATRSYLRTYGITTNGLSASEMYAVGRAAVLAGDRLAERTGLRSDEAFRRAHGSVTVNVDSTANITTGTCGTAGGTVTCRSAPDTLTTLHEFGHVFDNWYPAASGDSGHLASDYLTRHLSARRPDDVIGFDGTYMTRTVLGYKCGHSPCMGNSPQQWPGYYADNPLLRPQEEFADMYLNYLLDDVAIYQETNGFADDVYGSARRSHMDSVMNILLVNLGMLP